MVPPYYGTWHLAVDTPMLRVLALLNTLNTVVLLRSTRYVVCSEYGSRRTRSNTGSSGSAEGIVFPRLIVLTTRHSCILSTSSVSLQSNFTPSVHVRGKICGHLSKRRTYEPYEYTWYQVLLIILGVLESQLCE